MNALQVYIEASYTSIALRNACYLFILREPCYPMWQKGRAPFRLWKLNSLVPEGYIGPICCPFWIICCYQFNLIVDYKYRAGITLEHTN